MTLQIKVGTLTLTEVRDEQIPQEFAAWHQTVRIEPGTYDVFAILDWYDGGYKIRCISAPCEGITVSSDYRSHMLGQWGKSDNNCNGKRATAHVQLPMYGVVSESCSMDALLAQATLCDAIVRVEHDPAENDPTWTRGTMWRFVWNSERKPVITERARYSGGTSVATLAP